MSVRAIGKGVRISPRKMAVVASLVRGRSVSDALVILEHTPLRAAKVISKVVAAARANASHNHNFKPDSLQIVEISVTPGMRLKRFRPAAQGRALPYQHKTSHIRVVVDGDKRESKRPITKKVSAKSEEHTSELQSQSNL